MPEDRCLEIVQNYTKIYQKYTKHISKYIQVHLRYAKIYQDIQAAAGRGPGARPGVAAPPPPGILYIFVYLGRIWIYLNILWLYFWYSLGRNGWMLGWHAGRLEMLADFIPMGHQY